jgi:hypothetical protein
MLRVAKRSTIGAAAIVVIAMIPVVVLAANGIQGKPTATHGPKRTPAPTVIVTPRPTATPITPTPPPTIIVPTAPPPTPTLNAPTPPPPTPTVKPPTAPPPTATPIPPTAPPTAPPTPTLAPTPTPAPTAIPPVVLVGAGDIASCSSTGDEATATLLNSIAGTVFTLGDNVYDNGTATEFANCYGPSWGQSSILSRTRPTPGNHDYNTANASAYFAFFGSAAGDPTKGYYAYNLGAWRIYVLNTNTGTCSVVACGAGSAQETWLKNDLAANPHQCVAAMWHHPRFSSGQHGNNTVSQALWNDLYAAHADLILNGHDHTYERFAPQDPNGNLDNANGIVEMVVGTGGKDHYAFATVKANSLVRDNSASGVMKLSLSSTGWTFQFVHEAGKTFTDSGSGTCH